MTDDKLYNYEDDKEITIKFRGGKWRDGLTKEEVRELASQLPKETLEKLVECKEETEQQKVSDCCGCDVEVIGGGPKSYEDRTTQFMYGCKYCGEPCDAVEPDDKIEKIKAITDRNLYDKINEIIEKINHE